MSEAHAPDALTRMGSSAVSVLRFGLVESEIKIG
jgi:hypothetical protein